MEFLRLISLLHSVGHHCSGCDEQKDSDLLFLCSRIVLLCFQDLPHPINKYKRLHRIVISFLLVMLCLDLCLRGTLLSNFIWRVDYKIGLGDCFSYSSVILIVMWIWLLDKCATNFS